jgi:hypothetical protein
MLYRYKEPVYKEKKTDYMKIYDFLDWYNLYEESIFKIKEINKFI